MTIREGECGRCDGLRNSHTATVLGPASGWTPEEMEVFYFLIHIENDHDARPVKGAETKDDEQLNNRGRTPDVAQDTGVSA